MIYFLPIQERRAFINKHNREAAAEERAINEASRDSSQRSLEGTGINRYAEITQNDQRGG